MTLPLLSDHPAVNAAFAEFIGWAERRFAAPSPPFVKQTVLLRHGDANTTWVETGTYRGDTTHALAQQARFVYSIEPQPILCAEAMARFLTTDNVKILHGVSEQLFPELLPQLQGAVNFWLDGHYSKGVTFQGAQDTPIRDELAQIEQHRARFDPLVVLIDDIRCFNPQDPLYTAYPPLDFLVDWARRNGLAWQIEHDIFIARSGLSPL